MKPVKVKGQVYWSRHAEPYDDGRYGMDIGQLSETAVQKLQDEAMLDVKHKDLQQYFVTCKSNYPIKVVDTEGKEIDGKIGNGSECVAVIAPYSYNYKGKKGISAGVLEVVVTNLIEYNPGGSSTSSELAAMEAV
jgi:hypothetical protein